MEKNHRTEGSRISLKYKLSILLILLTLTPMLMAVIFLYRVLTGSLTESAREKEENILKNQMTNFDLAMHNFELVLNDLVTAESTQGFLQFRKEKESESYYSDLLLLTSKVDSLVSQRGDALQMAAFLWNDGDLPLVRGDSSGSDFSGNYTKKEPFRSILEADASIHWEVLGKEGSRGIYAYRTIYDVLTNQNIGAALIRFRIPYFQELLIRSMDEGAGCYLLDGTGKIVYQEGERISEMDSERELKELASALYGKRAVEIRKIGQKNYMVSYAESGVNGWEYFYLNPLANVRASIRQMTGIVLIVTAATAVLAVTAAFALFHYLNKPIWMLSQGMRKMEEGDLNIRLRIERRDELGILGDGFNRMAERIRQLIEKIEWEQGEKRRAEIRFLQAQITPHFLYNTLNGIKSLSRLKRSEDAAAMTTSLISLLRLAGSGEEWAALAQECEYVKNYMEIMSYRKKRAFQLSVNLEAGTERYKIPKFSLQPFVENSIIHGADDSLKREFWIRIESGIRGEMLLITISDNGKGFDAKHMHQRECGEGIRFSHIGIENVRERIHLYFGEAYGVEMESSPGNGTVVVISLPKDGWKEEKNLINGEEKRDAGFKL